MLNNPLKYTDPSGYRPEALFEEEEMRRRNGGGANGFNYFGWINRSMSMVGWTYSTGPTIEDFHYWDNNINGNFFGEASQSFTYWYRHRNNIKVDWESALAHALQFYSNTDDEDYFVIGSNGKKNSGSSELGILLNQYYDIVLTAGEGHIPYPEKEVKKLYKTIATFLRNTFLIAPGMINPFFGAEAILGDVGFAAMVEGDVGGMFVLAGKDKGRFFQYFELGWGFTVDVSGGFEYARVDLVGRASQFQASLLRGPRAKLFVSGAAASLSVGASFAWTPKDTDSRIVITGISLGFSIPLYHPLGGIGGGFNYGNTFLPSLPK